MNYVEIHGDSDFTKMFPISHRRMNACRDVSDLDFAHDMLDLQRMYRMEFSKSENTCYLVFYEDVSFEYPDGQYEDGTQAYSTYTGPMPVGVLKLAKRDSGIVLAYVTVAIAHRQTGVATKLIDKLVEWLHKNDVKHLMRTEPSEMGFMYTMGKISKMLEINNITFETV